MATYTLWYEGKIFEDDCEGINSLEFDRWEDAWRDGMWIANNGIHAEIKHNEYDVTFDCRTEEWY